MSTITVVINSFNQGATLERTIQSVLNQECSKEVVLIDAGSTDQSLEIIKRYRHEIDRFIDASCFDMGQSHALNTGLRLANGEISCWINSDDWFYPNILAQIIQAFRKNKSAMWAIANCDLWNEDKQAVFSTRSIKHLDLGIILEYGSRFWIPQQSTFWRTKFFHQCGGLNVADHVTMDVDLFTRFMAYSKPVLLDLTTSCYSFHDHSKGSVFRKESFVSQNRLRYSFSSSLREAWKRYDLNLDNIPVHFARALHSDGVRWAKMAYERAALNTLS